MSKATMTLNLTEQEMEVLTQLASDKGVSKTAIMRHALRLYQVVEVKIARGETTMPELIGLGSLAELRQRMASTRNANIRDKPHDQD